MFRRCSGLRPPVGGCRRARSEGGSVDSAAEETEFVALRIGQHDPCLVALADVNSPCPESEQTIEFLRLIDAQRSDVEMQPILGHLLLRDWFDQNGHRICLRGIDDLDRAIWFDIIGARPPENLAPELCESLGVMCIDDDRGECGCDASTYPGRSLVVTVSSAVSNLTPLW